VKRRIPDKLAPGEVAVQQCTNEWRRRINMCIHLIGALSVPNSKNEITFDEQAVLTSCSNPARSKFRSTGDIQTCRQVRAHLLSVADLRTIHQSIRNEDVHNICVKVLATDVNGQTWLNGEDAAQCHMSHLVERQNEGVTGTRCLFFHGSGVAKLKYDELNSQKGDYDGFLVSYPAYWKGVEKQVGDKCDKRFYVTETTARGWDDGGLQTEYCAAIARFQPHVIFAHSTANNVLAAGIANHVKGCEQIAKASGEVKSGQSVWFGMNAPLGGTPLADVLKDSCASIDGPTKSWYNGVCSAQFAAPYHGFAAIQTNHVNKAALSMTEQEVFGRAQLSCDAEGIVNHFDEDEPIRKECVALRDIAAEYQSGSMCGVAPDPFTTRARRVHAKSKTTFLRDDSIAIEWGRDATTKLTRDVVTGHDGLVPFASCRVPGKKYGLTPANAFYATSTNHDDGRCAHGEGGSSKQQPCSWLTARLRDGAARFERVHQFRDGRVVGAAPRSTPRSPSFAAFHYDQDAMKAAVKDELTIMDSKLAKSTPVGKAIGRMLKRKRKQKPAPPKKPQDLIKRDLKAEKKARDDAAAASAANLKAYEAAMA
jgi:hypothetical protein